MTKNILRAALAGIIVLLSTSFCILTPTFHMRPAFEFLPDQMPDARVGLPCDVDILVAQNETPVGNYAISDGTLPPGLELVMDEQLHTAKITGTPT